MSVFRDLPPSFLKPLAILAILATWGCRSAKLGDECVTSNDCSTRGDRACDTSQPAGYCTIAPCRTDTCPEEAACVAFGASESSCGLNDRKTSRLQRSFCLKSCEDNTDCRDGFVCVDPRLTPYFASILDSVQNKRVCLAALSGGGAATANPLLPVCSSGPFDAGTYPDAQAPASDAGADASEAGLNDAGAGDAKLPDASLDAGSDAL